MLASEGYEAVPAQIGQEALDLLRDRKEDPCLILTDLMMPKMDGWEFINFLTVHDIVITIPVIVMTASEEKNSCEEDYQETIQSGFDYLPCKRALRKTQRWAS